MAQFDIYVYADWIALYRLVFSAHFAKKKGVQFFEYNKDGL